MVLPAWRLDQPINLLTYLDVCAYDVFVYIKKGSVINSMRSLRSRLNLLRISAAAAVISPELLALEQLVLEALAAQERLKNAEQIGMRAARVSRLWGETPASAAAVREMNQATLDAYRTKSLARDALLTEQQSLPLFRAYGQDEKADAIERLLILGQSLLE